ncbi:uncharacterized protein TNCV_210601 [Trichonephila clavipes]|uniref:Mutator-like transposase domain-containing protein n=1 Tax=Trichonephila clavipes TaxID=2585209 RepID=A0A8X6SZD0_TRICX|nr:uncharacterized protein TNCV_210601 [Trichonephila clavipes]
MFATSTEVSTRNQLNAGYVDCSMTMGGSDSYAYYACRQKRSSLVYNKKLTRDGADVYGPEIKIKKEECINHVSKKLGTSLRKAVTEWQARGVSLGGKSRGSLKKDTIKKLSRYYQKRFARTKAAFARGKVPGPQVKHVNTPLKEAHLDKIMPIYQILVSNELIQRCIKCDTKCKREPSHHHMG